MRANLDLEDYNTDILIIVVFIYDLNGNIVMWVGDTQWIIQNV